MISGRVFALHDLLALLGRIRGGGDTNAKIIEAPWAWRGRKSRSDSLFRGLGSELKSSETTHDTQAVVRSCLFARLS